MFSMRPWRALAAVLLVISLLTPLFAAAQVFRWVAGDGSVHYGDLPPGTSQAQELDIRSDASVSPSGLRPGEQKRLARIATRREAVTQNPAGDATALADASERIAACERYTRDHHEAQQQLRAGYEAGEGDLLRRQVRASRAEMNRYCR